MTYQILKSAFIIEGSMSCRVVPKTVLLEKAKKQEKDQKAHDTSFEILRMQTTWPVTQRSPEAQTICLLYQLLCWRQVERLRELQG